MKIVYILFLITFAFRGYAQSENPDYTQLKVNGKSLFAFLSENLYKDFSTSRTLGVTGECWIRFKIDSVGSVTDIAITAGVPEPFKNFLIKYLNLTSGYWPVRTINGKPSKSDFLLQPITFVLKQTGRVKIKIDGYDIFAFFKS